MAIILAGGAGTRLGCLTNHRAKAVLPVGGTHRLIDISLSNLAHSHISNIGIVEQYLPEPLNAYVAGGRPWDLDRNHGGLPILPPFEGAKGEGFSRGNADALFRQTDFIRERDPQFVLVMSADQIYTMNYLDVVTTHVDANADLTIVTTELDEDVSRYGVVQADEHARVKAFDYKPEEPIGNVVTTEVFLYRADALLEAMEILASKGDLGDYGDTLVPWFVENRKVDEGAIVSRSLLSNGTTIGGEVDHREKFDAASMLPDGVTAG